MAKEIINRVAESKLRSFDLEDHYPIGRRELLDIKDWLYEGLILKEKEFRSALETHPWESYRGAYVAVYCSTDAIVPGWAFLLVATKLLPFALKTVQGSLETLETLVYQEALEKVDFSEYQDHPVIIKGCSTKPVPPNAYLLAAAHLQPIVSALMYGEACSSVPLFKKGRK